MFSYEFYKLIHLFCIIFFSGTIGLCFATDSPPKWAKISTGIISLVIFVAGMGLVARIGIDHGEGWPKWLMAKLVLWLILAILTPLLNKRLKAKRRRQGFLILMILMGVVSYLGVYKPL